jgi:ATP-dependent DNA helicase RecQ
MQASPRQVFADDLSDTPIAPPPVRKSLGDSARETLRRFRAGESIEQIARDRDVTTGAIMGHIAEGIERGEPVDLARFFTDDEMGKVTAAFNQNGFGNLGGVFDTLGGTIEYGKLRIFRSAANARKTMAPAKH